MAISRATYCTREDILDVLSVLQSPRSYPAIDRAIESAATNIDRRCHRTFHPTTATRQFRWPEPNSSAAGWRFWLNADEVVSVSTLTSGGTALTDYFLEPQSSGPPYTHIEVDTGSQAAFDVGDSAQRSLVVAGVFGYTDAVQAVSVLSGAVTTTSATTLTVADGSQVGVGDLLLIGTERMIVTGRAQVSSGQTLLTPLTAASSSTSVAVTTGSAFHVGEVLTLDAEAMRVQDVAGNTLIVERAVNASVLATHTGATIFVPRTLTVVRGANGTTAATHLDAAAVSRSVVPAPVRALAVGEALVEIQQGAAGYARTAGSGDNERPIGAGAGLNDLRDQVETGFQRKARIRAV